MLTLLTSGSSEQAYVVMAHFQLIQKRMPKILEDDFKYFFLRCAHIILRRKLVRLMGRRLPLTDMPVYEALLLLLYAGMVVAAFFLGTAPTPARKIGRPSVCGRWSRKFAR